MNNKYIGHSSQISGVEEHRLVGGKGDGMRLLEVRNGLGLNFTVSVDRAADISRLSFKGDNYGCFSPCGYVAPAYITFDTKSLDYFVEWKMLGEKDYVLGLEPGNCHPDGRDVMRKENTLKLIKPSEKISYKVQIEMIQGIEDWEKIKEEE